MYTSEQQQQQKHKRKSPISNLPIVLSKMHMS